MSDPESSPEWVVSHRFLQSDSQPPSAETELLTAARRLWPRVLSHARKELPKWNPDDSVALATEVWEDVLQSVFRTLQRRQGGLAGISDLDAYLFGVFLHRFNRALKRERRRQNTVEFVATNSELEQVAGARVSKSAPDTENFILVNEVIESMDGWTREVFTARLYGYSWREIADHHGLSVPTAKLRFRSALRKLAERLRGGE